MDHLQRGDVLTAKGGGRYMVRRVEPTRRKGDPDVVLWSLNAGLELNGRFSMLYLLNRIEDRTMRVGRRVDAARVIHEATESRRGKAVAG